MRIFIITICVIFYGNLSGQWHPVQKDFFRDKKITESALIESLLVQHKNGSINGFTFEKQKSKLDKAGNTHTKYKQKIGDIPINNATIIIHSQNGYVKNKNGNHYTIDKELNVHQIDEAVAIDKAKERFISVISEKLNAEISLDDVIIEKVEKSYSDSQFPKYTNTLVPSFDVHLSLSQHAIALMILIDASTGKVLFENDKIRHNSVPGIGKSNYYGNVPINLDSISHQKFVFHDNSRGASITVNDFYSKNPIEAKTSQIDFEDPWENAAIDVLYGTRKFYDFMDEKLNFKSLDDEDYPLVANVGRHLYNNAFWNGQSTNYGSGDCNKYSPFTAIDVVGHEFAHGITTFNSELFYQGESGALNESFSDIIGKSLEKWAQPEKFTWVLGKTIFRSASPFRTMNAPHLHNHPSVYKGYNWETLVFLSFGVHTNSAVCNLWYYLLCEGKKGKNELGINYDVVPIGMEKALEIVFHTHINYLTANSDYLEMYYFTLEAAEDLFPGDTHVISSIKEAWKAVGITDDILNQTNILDAFTLSINEMPNGSALCDRKIANMDFIVKYNGNDVIPANTPIETKIYTYKTKFNQNGSLSSSYDTIYNSIYVSESPISKGDRLVFKIGNEVNYDSLIFGMNFYAILKYNVQNKEIKFTSSSYTLNVIITDVDPEDVFRPGNIKSVGAKNKCNPSEGFSYMNFDLISNICDTTAVPFKIVIKNEKASHEFIYLASPPKGSYNQIVMDLRTIKFEEIENLENSILEIYSTVNGNEYLEISHDLSQYFGPYLKPSDIINFDNNIEHQALTTTLCANCEKSISGGAMTIKTKNFEENLDTCVEPDIYYDVKKELANNLSEVLVCMDTEDIINPILHFDTYLLQNSPYNNIVKVNDGDEYLGNLNISSTENKIKSYSVPLLKNGKFGIKFRGLLHNSSWRIDNIRLESSSNTEDNHTSDLSFIINNPVSDILGIKIHDHEIGSDCMIYKSTGEQIYNNKLSDQQTEISVMDWPSGMYIVSLKTKKGSVSKKIIVAH